MQGTMLYGPWDIRFEKRPDPAIIEPTDAILIHTLAVLLLATFSAACTPSSTLAPTTTPPVPTAALMPSPTVPAPSVVPQALTSPPPTAMTAAAPPTGTPHERSDGMKIRIKVGDQKITATLNDSKTLIILGKIDGSIDALLTPGSVEATIEMIE